MKPEKKVQKLESKKSKVLAGYKKASDKAEYASYGRKPIREAIKESKAKKVIKVTNKLRKAKGSV